MNGRIRLQSGGKAHPIAKKITKKFDTKKYKDNVNHISLTKDIITTTLEHCRRPYIAWSGGKDSEIVRHITHSIDPSIQMIHSDDEIYDPDTIAWLEINQSIYGDLLKFVAGSGSTHAGWHRPWTWEPYWRPWPSYLEESPTYEGKPSPLTRSASSMGYDGMLVGTRGAESRERARIAKEYGAVIGGPGAVKVNPIIHWTDEQVWDYIDEEMLPVCAAYDILSDEIEPLRRVGPMVLRPRAVMEKHWPDDLARAEERYKRTWF